MPKTTLTNAQREAKLAKMRIWNAAHLEYKRQWRLAHLEATRKAERAARRRWRAANPEASLLSSRQGHEKRRDYDRRYALAYAAAHREAHRENARRRRAADPAAIQEANRRYWVEHPDASRNYQQTRRTRKLGASGAASIETVAARWAMWGGKCWMCGKVATDTDHVKPLSKGGSNWPANLRPSCQSCNSRKHDTWPLEPWQLLARVSVLLTTQN